MSRLRVAVLDHVTERGGAQLAIARLAGRLADDVELTFVLGGPGSFQDRLESAGHRVEVVGLGAVRKMQIAGIRPVADLGAHGPEVLGAARRIARVSGIRPRNGIAITFAAASAPPVPNGSLISPQCGHA